MLTCFVKKQTKTRIGFLQARFEGCFSSRHCYPLWVCFFLSWEGFGDITEDGSHSLRNSETLHGMLIKKTQSVYIYIYLFLSVIMFWSKVKCYGRFCQRRVLSQCRRFSSREAASPQGASGYSSTYSFYLLRLVKSSSVRVCCSVTVVLWLDN